MDGWHNTQSHEIFEGHIGVNIIRPTDPSNPEYVVIFRFDTYDNLAKWEKSETRKEWLDMSKAESEGEHIVEKQTSLEFWFTPSSGNTDVDIPVAVPPRYKMAIVSHNTDHLCSGVGFASPNKAADCRLSRPDKHACRSWNNGPPHDVCDNAISDKAIETLAEQEKTILSQCQ